MRKAAIAVGIFVVAIVAILLIFAARFNVNQYHGTIQAELQKRLGRPVILGDMHLNLFPPRFRVENLAIADDPAFSPEAPFLTAQQLDVAVKLLPLLHKQVEIDSVNLQRPSVNLIKNQGGTWNFASLGHAAPQDATQPPSGQEQFSLHALMISDGQVSVLEQQKSKTPSVYDHIDISLQNFSPNKSFTVDAAIHIAGAGSQEARLQGEGGPIQAGQPAATPFRGTLNLKQVSLSDLSKFFSAPALGGTDGILSGQTKINNDSGKLTAQGETNVQNAKVRGIDLGYPIAAQYDLTDDLAADMLTIRNLILKLGSTPLQMSGTVNSKATPALLDLDVKANNVSIAEAAKLAAASGMALSQGTNVTGNVNANIQAQGAADKPALNGAITGSNIEMTGKDIAQPVRIQSVTLELSPSQIQSKPFNLMSGDTTLNVQFALRNYLAPAPLVDATVRAPSAQLPSILAIAKAYGVTSLDKVSGAGTLNLDMHAAGPIRSINTAELLRALNGTMNLDFNNVKYSGADVSHELASIAGFLNGNVGTQSAQGVTNILKMTGNVLVRNGIAQTNNLQAKLDIGNVGATGTANLVDETLNMRVTAVLSQASSQKAGGNGIGGFMQTALANNHGELVIPATVTGTFSHPKFAPDVQQIAQMKVKGLMPSADNPLGGASGMLGNLLGQKNPTPAQGQPPNTQQQPNPVNQILDIFGKKKKQN